MTIQQTISEGGGMVLNNVEVIKDWGQKAGQTPHRAVQVKDSTGSTMLKFWGASSNQGFNPGEIITVQAVGSDGNITASEYQGRVSLNCNSCEVIRGGNAAPAAPQSASGFYGGSPAPTPVPSPPAASGVAGKSYLSPDALARAQVAHFAMIYKELNSVADLTNADPSSVLVAAAQMTGSAADWWFGGKWPGMPLENRQ